MPNEVDHAIERSVAELRTILTSIELNAAEQELVNAAAARIVDVVFGLLNEFPMEKQLQMRYVVLAVAIGALLGPWPERGQGAAMFKPSKQ